MADIRLTTNNDIYEHTKGKDWANIYGLAGNDKIIIHGNALDAIPDTYRRYLEGRFRDEFELAGTPLRIEFKSSFNPYADN